LADVIAPLLYGRGPELQGAVLAELVSLWLAGHPPELREEALARWLDLMHDLLPLNAMRVRGE
jgi:hypothetical protein